MKYNKLVRNKIPEFIERDGKKAVTRILDDKEYKIYLGKKLDEEVAEFHKSGSIEELADILEVLYAICQSRGIPVKVLLIERLTKSVNRGGFDKKILLEEILD